VNFYVIATYMLASITYGAAGILISGYLLTPAWTRAPPIYCRRSPRSCLAALARRRHRQCGRDRGRCPVLTQLQQVLTANGAAASVEFIIQGSIIRLGMLRETCLGVAVERRRRPLRDDLARRRGRSLGQDS